MDNKEIIYKDKIVFSDTDDFKPVHIFECGQVFRWRPEDESGGVYTGFAGPYAARVRYDESERELSIDACGGTREFWYDYFDLGTDYGEIKRTLVSNEPAIRNATEHGCGIRILNQDLFETIISFIISQNNNIPRIRKCIEALCGRYGDEIEGTDRHAFPRPEALASAREDDMAALRLGYRGPYIIESAKKYLRDGCPACREDLLSMHGIGPKVANCIMLFGLRDVEAFPIDTWVRHIMNDMYGIDEKDTKKMHETACERFGEYAGYAQQYLFYYYRDNKESSSKQTMLVKTGLKM